MTLTKTQRELLERAAANPHGVTSVQAGFITSRKHGGYGQRARHAAQKLRDLGLFTHVETYHSVHQLVHRFGADHGSDSVWSVTDLGRETLKKLTEKE